MLSSCLVLSELTQQPSCDQWSVDVLPAFHGTSMQTVVQEVENLEPLVRLQQLWLGRNRIPEVGRGLQALTGLRQLSLQANRLVSISGLETLTCLEELYLSQNGIRQVSGLESLSSLKVLDLAYNPIVKVCIASQT